MMRDKPSQGIFIAGTDTGVGKTLISGAIARSLISSGIDCGIMKPIETGCRQGKSGLIPDDGCYLKLAARSKDLMALITPCRYQRPVSPYAAILQGETTSFPWAAIYEAYARLLKKHSFLIVEGIGGLMVPLTADLDQIDLILGLKIPVLLVARSGLGTLNHSLLTIRYGSERGLSFSGIVLNRTSEKEEPSEKNNLKILAERTKLPIFGPFPYLKKNRGGREKQIKDAHTLFEKESALKEHINRLLRM